MRARTTVAVIAPILAMGMIALAVRELDFEPGYPNAFIGSDTCSRCHRAIGDTWKTSLHHKMMRRTNEPDSVLAEWGGRGEQPAFSLQNAVWVVGSKWEQQFMGHDNGRDTMLGGAWSIGLRAWTVQGWDGWQVPVPDERCHGCHVVGLDVKTGHFEEPGIGCESCHGRGLWHADASGHGPIYMQLDSEVCGQCHTRGHASQGPYFFPVNYELGSPLDSYFNEVKADFIQNSSQWWGNGRERDRHQEYPAWRRGGHADALKTLRVGYDGRYGQVGPECLRCHSAEGAVYPQRTTTLADANNGVTCVVCHNVHGALDEPRSTCTSCHDQGPFHHRTVALKDHVPCPTSADVKCENCHMPVTVKVGGQYQLHSHAPGITSPEEGGRFESPSSCANGGCHSETPGSELQKNFEVFYRKPTPTDSGQQE